jgi:hypothetical protein
MKKKKKKKSNNKVKFSDKDPIQSPNGEEELHFFDAVTNPIPPRNLGPISRSNCRSRSGEWINRNRFKYEKVNEGRRKAKGKTILILKQRKETGNDNDQTAVVGRDDFLASVRSYI